MEFDGINCHTFCSQEITGGMGVDIAVEALGKPKTFLQCTQSVRDGGKAVMIGLAATGSLGEVDITRLVRRQVSFHIYEQIVCCVYVIIYFASS